MHLIIIAKGAGGAARCPLNRSSTTSTPPPRNYESLRAGFHRGSTPGTLTGCYTPRSYVVVIYGDRELRELGRRRSGRLLLLVVLETMTIMRITTGCLARSRLAKILPVCLRDVPRKAVVSCCQSKRRFRLTAARENPPPCDLLSRGSIAARAPVSRWSE